jgi:hypothetical protein
MEYIVILVFFPNYQDRLLEKTINMEHLGFQIRQSHFRLRRGEGEEEPTMISSHLQYITGFTPTKLLQKIYSLYTAIVKKRLYRIFRSKFSQGHRVIVHDSTHKNVGEDGECKSYTNIMEYKIIFTKQ